MVSIAPQALCTLLLVCLLVSGLKHPVARALMLTCYTDAAFNLGSIYRPGPRETDAWRFCAHSGLPVWVCRLGAVGWHLGFGVLVAMALPR